MIASARSALEARLQEAPDDTSARIALGELHLAMALAAQAEGEYALERPAGAVPLDLLRVRSLVPK
jgi:hypothetical protein